MALQDSKASSKDFWSHQKERQGGRRQREISNYIPAFRRGQNGGKNAFKDRLESTRYKEAQRKENFQQDFKMKVDLLNFSGKLDAEAFLVWVKNMESFFEYMEATEDKKVKMVALKIKSVHQLSGIKSKSIDV